MAKEKDFNPFGGGGDMMNIVLIGGAAFLAYWYTNNYGPQGAVTNAQGQKIALSYWDTWFGGAAAVAAAPAPVALPPAVNNPTPPVVSPPPVQTQQPTSIPDLCTPMIAAASTNNQMQKDQSGNIIGTLSQWNYFAHMYIPPSLPDPSVNGAGSADKMSSLVDAAGGNSGGLFTCQQWYALYTQAVHALGLAGLGAVIRTPIRARSMSFGGSFGGGYKSNPNRSGFPGTGGGTIQ